MRVYVAGPISKGDLEQNVLTAIDAANLIRNTGHHPFVPHLSYYWNLRHPREYEDWMELDFEWISVCEALVRLPGESAGSDREVALANQLGLPVFFGVEDFLANAPKIEPTNPG